MGHQDQHGQNLWLLALFSFRDQSCVNIQIMQSICSQIFLAKLEFCMKYIYNIALCIFTISDLLSSASSNKPL